MSEIAEIVGYAVMVCTAILFVIYALICVAEFSWWFVGHRRRSSLVLEAIKEHKARYPEKWSNTEHKRLLP